MFGWSKRKAPAVAPGDVVVAQPPGDVFPWLKGAVFTAIDEVVFAIPMGLFDIDRPISEFVFGPADMQINIPPAGGDVFFLRLLPGMSVSLAKSVQSRIVADDQQPRRLRVTRPTVEA